VLSGLGTDFFSPLFAVKPVSTHARVPFSTQPPISASEDFSFIKHFSPGRFFRLSLIPHQSTITSLDSFLFQIGGEDTVACIQYSPKDQTEPMTTSPILLTKVNYYPILNLPSLFAAMATGTRRWPQCVLPTPNCDSKIFEFRGAGRHRRKGRG